jgi:cation diffusion facilitator family transporter
MLSGGGSHHHHHHQDDGHHHHHQDNNLRAAYLHVLADALTSVLAIVGLLAGRFFGWDWMDPLMGLVGAAVIARWSWGLLRDSGLVLLDAVPDRHLAEAMRERLEIDGDRVTDLHLWRVGPGHNAAVVSLVTDRPAEPDHYKARLAGLPHLSHVTVEVLRCAAA